MITIGNQKVMGARNDLWTRITHFLTEAPTSMLLQIRQVATNAFDDVRWLQRTMALLMIKNCLYNAFFLPSFDIPFYSTPPRPVLPLPLS